MPQFQIIVPITSYVRYFIDAPTLTEAKAAVLSDEWDPVSKSDDQIDPDTNKWNVEVM